MKKHFLITSAAFLLLTSTTFAQEQNTTERTEPLASAQETPPAPAAVPEKNEWPRSLWGVYGGLGLPHGLNGGFEYLDQSRTWALAVDLGAFSYKPKDEANDKEEVALGSFALEGRYHPFTTAFYVAGALGAQAVSAKKTATFSGESVTPEVKVKNTFITPKIGWLWQFNSGLNFGVELGAQVPLSTKVEIEDGTTNPVVINDPEYVKNKQDVKDIAEKLGKQVLPHALIRLGYAF